MNKRLLNILLDPRGEAGGGGAAATLEAARKGTREAELNRFRSINQATEIMVGLYPEAAKQFRGLADKAINEGTGVADYNVELLKALPGIRKAQVASIGMTGKDIKRWSLSRALQNSINNNGVLRDGFEFDVSQEYRKQCKDVDLSSNGFLIPPDVIVGLDRRDPLVRNQRDLNVTTAAQGGNFVQTTVMTPIIEILRNKMVTQRLGIQTLSGLQGNIAIPRQTGAATAYTLAEQALLTKSTQAINQASASPHRIGAWNSYSKQLLLQSSVDVENFIRDDLMKVLAIKIDKLVLEGQGGADPLGVKNTVGIGAVTFGAAATWAKCLEFETALSLANADLGRMAYVTDPSVRGKWKAAPKIAASTFPIFLWEKGVWGDGSNDGEVNSYRAAATNQIANSNVAFGNWEDDILAMWGGYDVVVDPYTNATTGTVNIVINAFVDNIVRHAGSFAWSSDSGAQ